MENTETIDNENNATKKSNFRKVILAAGAVVVAVVVIGGWNYFSLQAPLNGVLAKDARNEGVSVYAYHQWLLSPGTIVFDLRSVSLENSAADVTRTLLQFAETQKAQHYEKVILAYKGEGRFLLEGDYFHQLGAEYGIQNPIYTLRTMPENVKHINGSAAFNTWEGGWLGVSGAQLKDLTAFHRQWFVHDMLAN
ncbi:hypothetical protein [Carnimonas nigrificans]|uniref:hypothetical protein n=1 Tax=Carnimonas nigrificans TaxID=64323 RepID=UPI00046F3ED0|nr:hypothetical protein [Carnimonas nigrificans]